MNLKERFERTPLPFERMAAIGKVLIFLALVLAEIILSVDCRDARVEGIPVLLVILPVSAALAAENAVKLFALRSFKRRIVCYVIDILLLLVLQEFVFDNINLGGVVNPYIYIMFIILLPLDIQGWVLLVLDVTISLISWVPTLSSSLSMSNVGPYSPEINFPSMCHSYLVALVDDDASQVQPVSVSLIVKKALGCIGF